jgi:hypothetical protein
MRYICFIKFGNTVKTGNSLNIVLSLYCDFVSCMCWSERYSLGSVLFWSVCSIQYLKQQTESRAQGLLRIWESVADTTSSVFYGIKRFITVFPREGQ